LQGGAGRFLFYYLNKLHFRAGQSQLARRAGKFLFLYVIICTSGQVKPTSKAGRFLFYYLNKLHFRAGQANLQGGAGFRARSMYCILLYLKTPHFTSGPVILFDVMLFK
jgi:hypothetical protein